MSKDDDVLMTALDEAVVDQNYAKFSALVRELTSEELRWLAQGIRAIDVMVCMEFGRRTVRQEREVLADVTGEDRPGTE